MQTWIASAIMDGCGNSYRWRSCSKVDTLTRRLSFCCVRWYLSYKLSYRDLVAMMGERGIGLAHTTILRWVQHYTPEFEKRWKRYARSVGGSWRCDETFIKVKGAWLYLYLYRAVDKGWENRGFLSESQAGR